MNFCSGRVKLISKYPKTLYICSSQIRYVFGHITFKFRVKMNPSIKRFNNQSCVVAIVVIALFFGTARADSNLETVDFTLPDIDGNLHSLSDYRGEWIIVNFWATWCAPCIKEIPELIELSKLSDPVKPVVIGIDFEEIDKVQLREFMNSLNMDYLVLIVGEAPLIPFEPLKGMPTTFIVSPQGQIVFRKIGAVTKEILLNELNDRTQTQ